MKEENLKAKKLSSRAVAAVSVFGIAVFAIVLFGNQFRKNESSYAEIKNESSGKILGEKEYISQKHKSENFYSPQVYFGGEAIAVPSGMESLSPEILNLRSELLVTKNEKDLKFVLSWKTNKPSLSSVEYKKSGDSQAKKYSEEGYGYVHSAELSRLNFSTTYSYQVKARDKWGNETQSENLTFYTGAPNVSIFDLLGGAFKDMFGWATRK